MKLKLNLVLVVLFLCCSSMNVFADEKALTIVALGDSTTAGTPAFEPSFNMHAAGRGNPKSQYAYWLVQKHPDWKILNRGINGQRSDEILNRFDRDVVKNNADVVIVIAGVNDIYQRKNIQGIQNNLKSMHEKAKENEIGFLLCTILPYDIATPEAFEDLKKMNAWILNYSKENNLPLCDTFKATSHPKNARMLISSFDHIHPDVDAYKIMAEPIEKAILELEKSNG